ncbi:WD40 repeat-like protein [Aspergillus eucalypticola CBS 122712]|uniref:WD40 repeat-like protein n=1 Tax=Aspergillus eucalypticola (strain CBS 122712 / IBT 29274) TaxID=1448314 RepID=A0A317V073_ASPEC|nr:WD40 repeat-like protein [Aspergillus eucalypticola CBS 122712]PWY67049.1 WD40 repeat-like protein [Aspergillus eucalypticola CBS 122712]
MTSESSFSSSSEHTGDPISCEENDNEMDERKFLKNWTYCIRSDFASLSGVPATWENGHPKHWGQEEAKIFLDGEATTPAISPDNQIIAIGIANQIHLFRVNTKERVNVLYGHPGEVVTVAFAPSLDKDSINKPDAPCYLLSSQSEEEGGGNGYIIVWELDQYGMKMPSLKEEQEQQITAADHQNTDFMHCFPGELGSFGGAVFSPDDNSLAASISWDGTARIWDILSGKSLHIIGPLDGQLWCGAFSPDSKYLAISQGGRDLIYIYNIPTAQPVSCIKLPTWSRSMAWSPDGRFLAGGLQIGTLCLWDPYTGIEKQRWSLHFDDFMMQEYATIGGVQFIGDKLIFRILEGTVEVYNLATNLKQQFTRGPDTKISRCPRGEMVCSRDSKLLIIPDSDGNLFASYPSIGLPRPFISNLSSAVRTIGGRKLALQWSNSRSWNN